MSSIHPVNDSTKQLLHASSPDLPTRTLNDTTHIDFMHHIGHDEALFIPEADPFNMATSTTVTTLMGKSSALSMPSPTTSPCDSNSTTPLTSSPKSTSILSPSFGQQYHRNNNSSTSCHHHNNVLLDDEAYFQLSEYLSQSSDTLHGVSDLAANHRRLLLGNNGAIKEEPTSSSSSLNMDGLQIRVIGTPDKSRVETQTRLCIQLLTRNGTKVTSWPCLKLPEHLLARSRLKKSLQQQRQAASSSSSLDNTISQQHLVLSDESSSLSKAIYLDAKVVCASQPDQPVKVCSGCIQRERKRAERSKNGANQHRNNNNVGSRSIIDNIPEQDRILLFNCGPMVNFSSGDAILPTRITCYCRHHNEKVGFCVQFTMKTDKGDIIAMGMSPPILITDDHKSTRQKGRKRDRTDFNSKSSSASNNGNNQKVRKLPSRTSPTSPVTPAASRRGSLSINTMEHISPMETADPNDLSILESPSLTPITTAAASFHTSLPTPGEERNNPCGNPLASFFPLPPLSSASSSPTLNPTLEHQPSMVVSSTSTSSSSISSSTEQQHQYISPEHLASSRVNSPSPSTPIRSTHHTNGGNTSTSRAPHLERLVPAQGPTYGGCEVTILGSNFYRGLTCLFGEHQATTVFWNPNTLVCVLPPAAHPGPVVVSFKQHSLVLEGQDVPLFTYYDANDQALLELALQVVGLKMTGKLQDAKQIAMRIVQGGDNNPFLSQQQQQQQNNNGHHHKNDVLGPPTNDNTWMMSPNPVMTMNKQSLNDQQDEGPLLLEDRVIQILDQYQGTTHELLHVRTPVAGHTLLHLAAWTGYTKLAIKLINMCPEMLDACDRNGLTPLSLARIKGHNTSIVLDVMVQTSANQQSAITIPHHSMDPITTAQSPSSPMPSIMLQDPFRYHQYPLMNTPTTPMQDNTITYHIKPTLTTTRNNNSRPSTVSDMLPYSSICSSITPLLVGMRV